MPLEFQSEFQEVETPIATRGGSDTAAGSLPRDHGFEALDTEDIFLSESVARGLTAEVFRAQWRGREVAVKRYFKHRGVDARRAASICRELDIMAKIRHPNLVEFIGACVSRMPWQTVTEYCRGGSLEGLLHGRSLVETVIPQQVKMCVDVARAMEYLHAFDPQIIHRDLKSKNLLLVEELASSEDTPVVKVADFGASRMRDPQDEAESWGRMTMEVGTIHWMAPEVLARSDYDEMVDVYSYAMVMYEVLAGERPFEDRYPGQVIKLVQSGERPELRAVPDTCPPKLLDLMTSCWEHDPRKRPPFSDVVGAVESVMRSSS